MFIWWGPELIQFYNDAYRETMGPERHPSALGARGRECWSEIWDIIGPQIEFVMADKGSTWDVERLVPVTRHGRREDVWWTYSYSPIDFEGGVGGVLVVCNDVTVQHMAKVALENQTRRLESLFEKAPCFIAIVRGQDHIFELANAAYRGLIGGRDVIGKPVRDVLPEVEGQGFVSLLDTVLQSGTAHVGRRVPIQLQSAANGSLKTYYLDFVYAPLVEPDGKVTGIFVEGADVTDHVQAEQRVNLINAELKHRVKNTLTVVSAISSQTFRNLDDTTPLRAFQGRLAALGRAHDLFIEANWEESPLAAIVETALAPYRTADAHFSIAGPRTLIASKQALSLSLALHELATNATKYGALSRPGGRIDISWSIQDEHAVPRFAFTWKETGGPPVTEPGKTGFGSILITRVLKEDFGGAVDVTYDKDGLVCRLTTAAENLAPVQYSAD
jgi:two-component sensor histidine kinase